MEPLGNAGVPENVVVDIVGHEKTTMTYGLYSGGVSLAVKREALPRQGNASPEILCRWAATGYTTPLARDYFLPRCFVRHSRASVFAFVI